MNPIHGQMPRVGFEPVSTRRVSMTVLLSDLCMKRRTFFLSALTVYLISLFSFFDSARLPDTPTQSTDMLTGQRRKRGYYEAGAAFAQVNH